MTKFRAEIFLAPGLKHEHSNRHRSGVFGVGLVNIARSDLFFVSVTPSDLHRRLPFFIHSPPVGPGFRRSPGMKKYTRRVLVLGYILVSYPAT